MAASKSKFISLASRDAGGFHGFQSLDNGVTWQEIAGHKSRKEWRAYAKANGFTLREVRKVKLATSNA